MSLGKLLTFVVLAMPSDRTFTFCDLLKYWRIIEARGWSNAHLQAIKRQQFDQHWHSCRHEEGGCCTITRTSTEATLLRMIHHHNKANNTPVIKSGMAIRYALHTRQRREQEHGKLNATVHATEHRYYLVSWPRKLDALIELQTPIARDGGRMRKSPHSCLIRSWLCCTRCSSPVSPTEAAMSENFWRVIDTSRRRLETSGPRLCMQVLARTDGSTALPSEALVATLAALTVLVSGFPATTAPCVVKLGAPSSISFAVGFSCTSSAACKARVSSAVGFSLNFWSQ